jgi:hypothetical protein
MKKVTPIIFIVVALLLATCPTRTTAAATYENYLSIRAGQTFTFFYVVTPEDDAHQSPLSVDIPITINTIEDLVTNVSCNVTYTATYKVLVDGIPKDQAHMTTRMLNNSINSTEYVRDAKNPWELFFTNNKETTNRSVVVPVSANWSIGSGYVTWLTSGVLSAAYFHTVIDGAECLVTIAIKTSSGGGVPGPSTALILVVAAIPTALLAYRIGKKARREKVE